MAALSTFEQTKSFPQTHIAFKSVFGGALTKLSVAAKLLRYRVHEFEPFVSFRFERGPFTVRTAQSRRDVEECLKLRFQVFHREYKNVPQTYGVDVDELDIHCDHLMIIDRRTRRLAGTYRLNCSLFSDEFYSPREFEMDQLLGIPGTKLELGRACIDRSQRSGAVINLLWRGIAEYIRQTDTKVLFGCASIKTSDSLVAGMLAKYLFDNGHMLEDAVVNPSETYLLPDLFEAKCRIAETPELFDARTAATLIPPLLGLYLKAGAKVCGEPAYDREFNCIDFLVRLKVDRMNPLFRERYGV